MFTKEVIIICEILYEKFSPAVGTPILISFIKSSLGKGNKYFIDTDPLIINDIVASTICKGADIYISSNPDRYNALAINWLCNNKELISAIIRLGDINVVEKLHESEIYNCGLTNYIRLCNYFYGKD